MDYMGIVNLSSAMSQNKILSDVGVALLSKSLDNAESAGAELVGMMDAAAMERSVNPAVGGMIDISL